MVEITNMVNISNFQFQLNEEIKDSLSGFPVTGLKKLFRMSLLKYLYSKYSLGKIINIKKIKITKKLFAISFSFFILIIAKNMIIADDK